MIYLVGVHYRGKKYKQIVGYRVYSTEKNIIKDGAVESICTHITSGKMDIVDCCVENGELKSLNGDISRFPKIVDLNKVESTPIIILNEIRGKGYTICDYKGSCLKVDENVAISMARKFGIANGKLVTTNNRTFISSISGEYAVIADDNEITGKCENNVDKVSSAAGTDEDEKSNDTDKSIKSSPMMEERPPFLRMRDIQDKSGMTVEQKFTVALVALKEIRVFYYAIIAAVKRVETDRIRTMGVSIDTIFINPAYVEKLTVQQLIFVLMHEVLHLAMEHPLRIGNRNRLLWNIAGDLFINKVLTDEFKLKVGGSTVVDQRDTRSIGIQCPRDILYNDSINSKKDYIEKIYEQLLNEVKTALDEFNKRIEDKKNRNEESGNGKAGGIKVHIDSKSGNGSNEADGEKNNGEDESDEGRGGIDISDVTYHGKKIADKMDGDIVETEDERQMSDVEKENRSRTVLERASINSRQMGYGGDVNSVIERYVKENLAPKVNWTSLIKNKLSKASEKITTYSMPDRRFLSRGRIMPGPKPMDLDTLENIWVCCDTSGSISDEDLGIAFGQIAQLFKSFKAKAELIWWDTKVYYGGNFDKIKELIKMRPLGGGGTDVNCVFEYFSVGDFRNGKKKKPTIIIVFTDGCFGGVDSKYSSFRDTVWVISSGNENQFKRPFGMQAKLTL